MGDEEVRQARRRVYELEYTSTMEWNHQDRMQAEIVCHNFDVVGDMLEKGLITKRVIENWDFTIKRCWKIVKPLIEQYRMERPHPGLWIYFQRLAEGSFGT